MGSLDVDSFFTNISLKENIGICTNTLFFFKYEKSRMFKSKIELKKLSCLATKESYFVFNKNLYNQVKGVAMGSTLGLIFLFAFLLYFEKNF